MWRLLFIFLCVDNISSAFIIEREKKCGYESCVKSDPNKLNIHIVPHSHDDVGWLKTVDQYYHGTHTFIQRAGVRLIIDSYIESLLKDPKRRFIQVETAFFWNWWKKQNEEKRNIVRGLVDEGRLEIIGGGWSMADEATTHYHSLVDQYTWGFRKLNDSLGECARPKIGWQIDPFGHSREQAAMFALLGFDGYFLGRLHWADKNERLLNKEAEFIWKANPSLGSSADIFTGVLYNNYAPPQGFCFDLLCDDEPMVDDPTTPEYNIPRKVQEFLSYCRAQSTSYRTNNILITMGEDFNYQYAEMYFENLDQLIKYANQRNGSDYNLFYSTPSCYLKALHDEKLKWSVKEDDFFPYASDPHAYWTGYFTSRPTLKYFERIGNNFLQVVKQLGTAVPVEENEKHLEWLREAMGVMQHHDAVTGTEKQHVARDYARILHHAIVESEHVLKNSLRKLTKKTNAPALEFNTCLLLNISSCEYTETNENFIVTAYNPSSHKNTHHVRLPVTGDAYTVRDHLGRKLETQIVPIPDPIKNIPGRTSSATNELLFVATDTPALGFQSFYVAKKTEQGSLDNFHEVLNQSFALGPNQNINMKIVDGNQIKIIVKDKEFFASTMFYEAATGNNKVYQNRSSGAYVFRPKITDPIGFNKSNAKISYESGGLMSELRIEMNDWVTNIFRVYYSDLNVVESTWIIGPIPIEDNVGKEVVVRYNTGIRGTDGVFYTDSNGRQMIRRKRKTEDTVEPVAGNYYPVTNRIYLQNDTYRFSVLTDRSQGGSSMKDGQLELMIHRRLLNDDAFGVGEALNETAFGKGLVAIGKHYIIVLPSKTNPDLLREEKLLLLQLELQPLLTFTPLDTMSFDEYRKNYNMQYSMLKKALPENVNILTLEPWKDDTILLRLEHLFEIGESNIWSQPVEVNIQDLFTEFTITSITEMTLGANQKLSELNRLKWTAEKENILDNDNFASVTVSEDTINIVLKPSEIRTFIIKVQR